MFISRDPFSRIEIISNNLIL
uniref:Uncharacterized protein n=1 Tax=Arundo donax TaxID=35708 RepID=A0A0A9FVI5_ARUDO